MRALYPEVDEVLRWLSRCGDARMTGTGGERVRALRRARAGATMVAKPARRLERLRCQGNEPLGRSRVSVKFRAEGAGGAVGLTPSSTRVGA